MRDGGKWKEVEETVQKEGKRRGKTGEGEEEKEWKREERGRGGGEGWGVTKGLSQSSQQKGTLTWARVAAMEEEVEVVFWK